MLRRLIKYFAHHKNLFFIIFLAAVLRFVLPNTPPSLNWDEVSHGYNAYSILKSGRDEWGKLLPIIFRAYGDYKLPVYIYLTALSEFFLGLTPFAVRLPSILAGIGTVVFTYLLVGEMINGKEILINKKNGLTINHKPLAIVASLLVAVEPWSLFLSRAAFEANLALFFFIAGIYFFLRSTNSPAFHFSFLTSTILLGLTVFTYNSYRVFTPLMMGVLIMVYWKDLKSFYKSSPHTIHYSLITFAIFLLPMFYQLLGTTGSARYSWVSILDQGSINKINESRGSGCPRILCNKYTYTLKEFSKNYLSHFSPQFLFTKGGSDYQFSIPGTGVLYFINIPFLILGLIFVLKSKSLILKSRLLIISWLLLAPVASSLTREAPHVLRAVSLLPIPMVLTSIGFIFVSNLLNKKFIIISTFLYGILIFGFTEDYLIKYFGEYRKNYSESWQYGYKEVSSYINDNYSNYDKIVITKKYGEPHEFLLFNLAWHPPRYRGDSNLNRFYQTNWYWVDGFDKFYFVNDWQIKDNGKEFELESGQVVDCKNDTCLLVTSPENVSSGWNKLETINFLDGKPAFEIYEN